MESSRWQDVLLKFTYVNWRGGEHQYIIEPEKLHPRVEGSRATAYWCISGQVVTRDGDPRPEMGPTRRRTFDLIGMVNVEEIERST